jgi:hypothetical protein
MGLQTIAISLAGFGAQESLVLKRYLFLILLLILALLFEL